MADSLRFRFVSYTGTALEAFDRTPLCSDVASKLVPLQVCVHGSDFTLPKQRHPTPGRTQTKGDRYG